MGIFMMFQCPETGDDLASGILREDERVHPSRRILEVRCLECEGIHFLDTTASQSVYSDNLDLPRPNPVRRS
jgi:hypothetical protein